MSCFESRRVRVRGADLLVHHLGGDGPPVMAVHATGFHGRCWWPLAAALTPQFSVWAIDQRGHGGSGKDPTRTYDYEEFAADLLAVVDSLGGSGWRAIGHSLGGAVILLAEAARPGTFMSAACYEPVVMPPGGLPDEMSAPSITLARRRRASFASRQEALENYRSKPPFDRFPPEALKTYVEYGLVDADDGGVTLACRPDDEAAMYEAALTAPVLDRLGLVDTPVTVMAGAIGEDPMAEVASHVAEQLPRGELRRFSQLDHFGPVTAPAEVGAAMASALLGQRS